MNLGSTLYHLSTMATPAFPSEMPTELPAAPGLAAAAATAAAPAAFANAPAAAGAALPTASAASTAPSDGQRLARAVVPAASSSARTTTLSVSLPMIRVNASVLKSIHGFGDMDDMLFKDKVLRRMAPGQLDMYEDDASDKIAVADVVAALLGMSADGARQWLSNKKNMNKDIAPSLAYVKGTKVRFLNQFK